MPGVVKQGHISRACCSKVGLKARSDLSLARFFVYQRLYLQGKPPSLSFFQEFFKAQHVAYTAAERLNGVEVRINPYQQGIQYRFGCKHRGGSR